MTGSTDEREQLGAEKRFALARGTLRNQIRTGSTLPQQKVTTREFMAEEVYSKVRLRDESQTLV